MSPDVNLLLIAGSIVTFLMAMRTNAAFSFFGLTAGYILVSKVSPDLGSSFQTPFFRILMLLGPFAFLAWVYKRSQKTPIKMAMQIPAALAASALGTLLVVDFLPQDTKNTIQGGSLWPQIAKIDHLVFAGSIAVATLMLFVVKKQAARKAAEEKKALGGHNDGKKGKH